MGSVVVVLCIIVIWGLYLWLFIFIVVWCVVFCVLWVSCMSLLGGDDGVVNKILGLF